MSLPEGEAETVPGRMRRNRVLPCYFSDNGFGRRQRRPLAA